MSSAPRVLVTGSTGFVGRTVVPMLRERGCDVAELPREEAAAAPSRVVERIVQLEPVAVIHLATRFIAMHEPDDIPDLIASNITLGTVVAEAALHANARFVSVGTAWQHFEGSDYSPVSLYSSTKQALSTILEYYSNVRGLDWRDVTLFDTYGPGDVRPKLVPTMLRASMTGDPLQMSDGHQLIDLTYVDDVARGIVGVALDDDAPVSSVLRSWAPVSIRDLVAHVERATGGAVNVEWGARPTRPREMITDWVFGASPPGWSASVSLFEGLSRTWTALSQARPAE